MGPTVLEISASLDGFVAGQNASHELTIAWFRDPAGSIVSVIEG